MAGDETERGLELLVQVLGEAGYELRRRESREGIVLEASRWPDEGFAIYIRAIQRWSGPGQAFRTRREARQDQTKGLTPVLLDYIPHLDLFATLPPGQARASGVISLLATEVVAFLRMTAERERSGRRRGSSKRMLTDLPGESIGTVGGPIGISPTPDLPPRLDSTAAERNLIQTGFSPAADASVAQSPLSPLSPGSEYLFWFAVGTKTENSIETAEAALPEGLLERARLSVVVFPFEGELALTGKTRGAIQVDAEGGATAVETAFLPDLPEDLLSRFLFFPVKTPGRPGSYRLRCNLYFGSTLVQSRLVTAVVGGRPVAGTQSIESVLDYRLTASIDLPSLAQIPGNDFSIFINGNGESHQFRFYREDGKELFRHESSLSAGQIESAIEIGRQALRMVAWGSEEEWDEKVHAYRYASSPRLDRLTADLGRLALAGNRLYGPLAASLMGGASARRQLQSTTDVPGKIQVATGNDGFYVPVGLFYDHKIEPLPAGKRFQLCPDFAQDLANKNRGLEEARCMRDGCSRQDDAQVVCPSGFWGFRHEIGWPTSTDVPTGSQVAGGQPTVLIGVSTDSKLRRRRAHLAALRALVPAESVLVVENRQDFDARMSAREAQLVYLYCHGGLGSEGPYVEIGKPGAVQERIDYRHLTNRSWGEPPPHPLVFINGCHTTALGPSEVLDLVRGFVEETQAVGVVGTELTVFEPLACEFSETALRALLIDREEIGRAIRRARLELLRAYNPLGLVYVPFVSAGTRLGP